PRTMISMVAMLIFWTADLTASTRDRGASSLVVANPGPFALAHSHGGAGRVRGWSKKRRRPLLGSSAADGGADESSGAIIRVSQGARRSIRGAACGPLSTTAKVEDGKPLTSSAQPNRGPP